MRSEVEANRAVALYADTVRRICFMYLKNHSDVEDIFQDVFLKYILYEHSFESDAHEKAWLIRVAINTCKDELKSFFRKKVHSIEDVTPELCCIQENDQELLDHISRLPPKYKNVIYLFYYEGYTAVEIAKILKKNDNTIYTWLSRAREKLKKELGGEPIE